MRARLVCICNQAVVELEADTLKEMGPALSSALAAFHATQPHCSHEIGIEMDEIPESDKRLLIRCFKDHCDSVRELDTTCPIELVGALTLMFHTVHEGHPIEIIYDGRTWRSPVAP